MLTKIKGDATRPSGTGQKFIIHVCNDIGGWGAGFVVALSRRWPKPEYEYREWHRNKMYCGTVFALGEIQEVPVTESISVINMIGQHGVGVYNGSPPIRYDALRACVQKVAVLAREHKASIHLPYLIGCGLAGGEVDRVLEILNTELKDLAVYAYEL